MAILMKELDIKCLPKHLPEYIAVDVSNLGINEYLSAIVPLKSKIQYLII